MLVNGPMSTLWPAVVGGLIVLWIAVRKVLGIVQVEGPSMWPTLKNGDRVLALRYWPARWLRRGQIIVTRFPPHGQYQVFHPKAARGAVFIKRVAGLPGDTVVTHLTDLPDPLRSDAQLEHDSQGNRVWHIPPSHYFVRGDSLGHDSAIAGPIPFRYLRGIVLTKLPGRTDRDPARTILPDPPSDL